MPIIDTITTVLVTRTTHRLIGYSSHSGAVNGVFIPVPKATL